MGGMTSLVRAAVGAIPLIPRGDRLPDRALAATGVGIDRASVAAYCALTGLRYGDHVPLTYPFVLSFPTVMQMLTGFDFPFPAMGALHVANEITALRPIAVTDTLGITVRAGNLREHRKGLLADLTTEVRIGNETAWQQVSTFLHQQRTSLSDQPKPPPPKPGRLPAPNAVLSITPSVIRRYAAVGGDRNPIHTSVVAARLFGFPGVIAHGMYSAAAVLANIEGHLPDRVRYSVKFGKPVVLPARAGVYLHREPGGWDIALRHPTKGYPHLTATVRGLGD
jgi:hypothetical protein